MAADPMELADPDPRDRTIDRQRCAAHARSGERCRNSAIAGGTVCYFHGGAAPQVRARAQARLRRDLLGPALDVVHHLLTSDDAPAATRLAAARDVLDRIGVGHAFEQVSASNSTSVTIGTLNVSPALDEAILEALRRTEAMAADWATRQARAALPSQSGDAITPRTEDDVVDAVLVDEEAGGPPLPPSQGAQPPTQPPSSLRRRAPSPEGLEA